MIQAEAWPKLEEDKEKANDETAVYDELLQRIVANGYDLSKIKKTLQPGG